MTRSTCERCGSPIEYGRLERSGAFVALDVGPVDGGVLAVVGRPNGVPVVRWLTLAELERARERGNHLRRVHRDP